MIEFKYYLKKKQFYNICYADFISEKIIKKEKGILTYVILIFAILFGID
jgi:hypothetical protein